MDESGSQSNGYISKDEQEALSVIKTLQNDNGPVDKVLINTEPSKANKGKEFVNRSRHNATEYSIGRKGKGHEASAAGGGRRHDDEDEEERRKKDEVIGDPGKTDAVYCSICENWFPDNKEYLRHVAKKLCQGLI